MGFPITGSSALAIALTERPFSGLTVTQVTPLGAVGTTYTAGTAANQVDFLYAKQLTLAAAPQTLSLQAIQDVSGATANMLRVREFFVSVQDITLTHFVSIYAHNTNGWAFLPDFSQPLKAMPGGEAAVYLNDPASVGGGVGLVTGAASLNVVLDPGAFTIICNVVIAGCSSVT